MSELLAPKRRATVRECEVRRLPHHGDGSVGVFVRSDRAFGKDLPRTREADRGQVAERRHERGAVDPWLLQQARLEPALRLAANAIANGDLAGIDRLIKVINKLDKYSPSPAPMNAEFDEEIHRRLMDKLDRAAGRVLPPLEPPGQASNEFSSDQTNAPLKH